MKVLPLNSVVAFHGQFLSRSRLFSLQNKDSKKESTIIAIERQMRRPESFEYFSELEKVGEIANNKELWGVVGIRSRVSWGNCVQVKNGNLKLQQ